MGENQNANSGGIWEALAGGAAGTSQQTGNRTGESNKGGVTDINSASQRVNKGHTSNAGGIKNPPGKQKDRPASTAGAASTGAASTGAASTASTAGAAETGAEEGNASILEFPPEAYFLSGPKKGQLKKSWIEKFSGKTPKQNLTQPKRKSGFSSDKELKEIITEAFQLSFSWIDKLMSKLFGITDVWEISTAEAETLARVLLKRADRGDIVAIKAVNTIAENMDILQAGFIIVPRIAVTGKELKAKYGKQPRRKNPGGLPESDNPHT